MTARQASAIRRGLRFAVARGQQEVRLRRLTQDATDDRIVDEVHWTALRTIRTEEPIPLGGLARTAVRIKASDELAGVVDQLNGIVHSILPDWDAGSQSWVTRPTRNPASLFRAVLQGPGNARPLPDHRVDLDGLAAWRQHCAQHGFRADLVVDFEASVFEILSDIAAVGRATPTLIDGKWSVAIDRPQSTPVQHFTPRNSWGFRAEKAFPELPHAFRVRFANRDAGWSQDERLVYDDGFDAGSAVRIEALELPGITEPALVHKHARYHIASARLRPEVYSWFADIEHIVCRKGDLVAVAHDVPLWGLGWGRVKAVMEQEGEAAGVVLDEEVLMEAGKAYVARFRLADGQRLVRELVTEPGTTRTVTFPEPLPLAAAPEPGDLFMFGELGREVAELVVKAIERGPALTARIVAVDAAPAIHTADQGPIPPFDSKVSLPPGTLAPLITDIRSDEAVLFRDTDGALRAQIVLSVHHDGARPLTRIAGIQVRWRLAGSSGPWRMASADADAREIGLLEVGEGETYRIRARYRYRDGSHGPWTQLFTHTVVGLGTPPPDVPEAYVEGRTLLWRYPAPPPDFAGFRLRHRSGNRTNWGQGAPAHEGLITVTTFDLDRLPGGTRTVMIKAVDVGGNESEKPAVVVLQLGDLLQDNVIEEEDLAAAGFPGTIVNADVVDGELVASDTALYLADPEAPYLPEPDGPYLPGDYLALLWETDYQVPAVARAGDHVRLAKTISGPWTLSYAMHLPDGAAYDGDALFLPDDDALFLSEDEEVFLASAFTPFRPWPGAIEARPDELIRFRIASAGGDERGIVSAFTVVFDAPDIQELFDDLALAAEGSRLPLQKIWRRIKTVNLTLQDDGGNAATLKVLDKDESEGPLVRAFDAAGQGTAATIDAIVQGY